MLGALVIVFREVLEAALIIGIIAAATRDIPKRSRWLLAGLGMGLVGATGVAAGAEWISGMANGLGQEVFNAITQLIAVVMLAWHNIWMSSHGAALAGKARQVGGDIREGRKAGSVLFLITGLAVLREGSETVLFLYGIAAGSATSQNSVLAGGLIGIAAGVTVGWMLYAGLLRIPLRWFFAATSLLVLLLAAGMASQAAHFLIQADLLPSWGAPLWDTSTLIRQDSISGTLLHSLIGYDARPAGMQVVFYVFILLAITTGMKWSTRPSFQTTKIKELSHEN